MIFLLELAKESMKKIKDVILSLSRNLLLKAVQNTHYKDPSQAQDDTKELFRNNSFDGKAHFRGYLLSRMSFLRAKRSVMSAPLL